MGWEVGVRMFSQQTKTHIASCSAELMEGFHLPIPGRWNSPFSHVSYWEYAGKVEKGSGRAKVLSIDKDAYY